MLNARINIEGQSDAGNVCGTARKIRLSRTKPSNLDQYVNDRLWEDICNKIDRVLTPLDRSQKRMTLTIWLVTIPVILIIICAPYTAFLFGLLLMISLICLRRYKVAKSNKVLHDLKNVCDEVTKQNPRLTFSVKTQPYPNSNKRRHNFFSDMTYIEVTISNDDLEIPVSLEMPIAIAEVISPESAQYETLFQSGTAPTYIKDIDTPTGIYLAESLPSKESVAPSAPLEPEYEENTKVEYMYGKTITERLEELERMKPHISTKEYFEKRTDILSCI